MSLPAPLILPYAGIVPKFASPPVHCGEGSAILGRVTLGRDAEIGPYVLLRADGHTVDVGDEARIGRNTTLHIAHEVYPCVVGDRVVVGENACVHACVVGSDVLIEDGVVILDGSVVEDRVILEAGSIVFPRSKLAAGHIYAGMPAKPVRALEPGELEERMARARARPIDTEPKEFSGAWDEAPAAARDIFVAHTARLRGHVHAAPNSSIWFSNVFDAGAAEIVLGENTNVQDNTIVRCTGNGVVIGRDTTVGHNVMIEDCTIGENALIGIGSSVAKGSVVQDRVLLAAGARTEPGQVLESGWLWAGNPARPLSRLGEDKLAMVPRIVEHYCQYARDFRRAQEEAARAVA